LVFDGMKLFVRFHPKVGFFRKHAKCLREISLW
jgi:hypothetical protein